MQPPVAAAPPLSFGHAAVARRLVAALEASLQPGAGSSTEPALVIGVFGEWGAGKSRLLQTVAAALPAGDGKAVLNVVVPFNAWRYEREEHLLVPLLRVAQQCLSKALEEGVPEDVRRAERLSDRFILLGELAQTVYQHGGRELLQTALAAQGVAFKLPELKKDASKPEPSFRERWRQRGEALQRERLLQTPANQLHSLYYDFLEHLKAVTGRNPRALAFHRERLKYGGLGWWPRLKYRLRRFGIWIGTGDPPPKAQDFQVNLVFLIDDLDRCLPDKAVEVLEAIKLFLEVEGCAFVLALDEEVVERGIAHRYRDYALQGREGLTPITGAEYLEKLVHLPVRLPRPTGAAARDFLAGKWPDWFADASSQANDLATLVAAITPGVPRKLHRMTALLALAESLGAGDAKTPRRREWLAIVCALQLFAPALYRYLRLHGARLLITLADWRSDALFRDVAGLRKALQQQVLAVDSPAQLQYRLVLMRLPELCEAAMHNRSGFDLLELLARVGELHEKAALTGAQLGALMVFTEIESAADTAAAVPPVAAAVQPPPEFVAPPAAVEMPAAAGPAMTPVAAAPVPTQPQAGGVVEPVEPAMPTTAPLEARLENERALVEAVNSGELELVRVALSREGAAMSGRVISYALWGQLRASRLMEQLDAWVKRGAPADATQFLLQELRPHLSQVAAFDLLRDFGAPVQRVLKRPDWAQDVRVGDGNVALLAPPFVAGQEVWLETVRSHSAAEWHIPRGWACATHHLEGGEGRPGLSFGSDERYGVHAAIHLGDLEQRLRWVPAGKSAMGSPKGPPEEGELRTISLSRGFWMANTACSVALWSRVMGTPATGDGNLPMTGISAADIEAFLIRLGQGLPGCECRLPSEAEWEAACRAGSRTAWAFGNEVGPQQVHAASSAALPVAGLGPNAWGFFQMHGNVAELCRDLLADGQRTAESWLDPEGPPGSESTWHAVRGGSFRTRIEQTRSAAVERVGRNADRDDMGFRFIVRARTADDQPPA